MDRPPASYSFPSTRGYEDPAAMLEGGYAALGQHDNLGHWRYFALGYSGFDRAFARYLEEPGAAAGWDDGRAGLAGDYMRGGA